MQYKTVCNIQTPVIIFLCLLLQACASQANKEEETSTPITMAPTAAVLSPELQRMQDTLILIEKKELAMAGETVTQLTIQGLEIMPCSRKTYLQEQRLKQQEDFNRYLAYLDNQAKQNKSMNNPLARQESQAKHNAVMAYLQQEMKKASEKRELYKAVYYLEVQTPARKYSQQKTSYLDENLQKIVADYSFLQAMF